MKLTLGLVTYSDAAHVNACLAAYLADPTVQQSFNLTTANPLPDGSNTLVLVLPAQAPQPAAQ